jgi:transporter family-2 protein
MTTNLIFVLAAAGAGVATAIQGAANAGLSAQAGLGAALVINASVVLIGSLVFFFAGGSPAIFFPDGTPWSLYTGGLCGFAIILAAAVVFPKIGAGPAVALMVLGQGIAALAIDHFGVMGLPRAPLTLARIAGFALILAGVVLLRR